MSRLYSAYICKAILTPDKTFNIDKNGKYPVYHKNIGYLCGDDYNIRKYQQFVLNDIFEDREFVKELVFLIKSLKMTRVLNVKKDSFIFGPYKKYNVDENVINKIRHFTTKFTFRLCRYTRTKAHIDIILLANEMIRDGVLPINALILSHVYMGYSSSYHKTSLAYGNDAISSMSPFLSGTSYIYLLYESKKSFRTAIEKNALSYNTVTNFYKTKSIENKIDFMRELNLLLDNKKYLEAEQFYIKSGHIIK